jgi:hypothetical protein
LTGLFPFVHLGKYSFFLCVLLLVLSGLVRNCCRFGRLFSCGYLNCIVVFHLGRFLLSFNLYCGGFIMFCNVCGVCVCGLCNLCVCVGFVMCDWLGNMYTLL